MANADENSVEQRSLANRVSRAEVASGSREIYEQAATTSTYEIPNLISRLKRNRDAQNFVKYNFCNGNWTLRIIRGDDTIGYHITKARSTMETINGQPTSGHRNIVHCRSYIRKNSGLKYLRRDEYFTHRRMGRSKCRKSKFPWHQLEESDTLKVRWTITCPTCQRKPSRTVIPERGVSDTTKRKNSEEGDIEFSFRTPIKLTLSVGKLLSDIRDLFTSEDGDITIKVNGREFKAHRTILQARSPVFSKMFIHNTTENKTEVIEVPDCEPEAFRQFLVYLYYGELGDIPKDILCNLYHIADKYDVKHLKELCVISMERNLSVESFYEIVELCVAQRNRTTGSSCDILRQTLQCNYSDGSLGGFNCSFTQDS